MPRTTNNRISASRFDKAAKRNYYNGNKRPRKPTSPMKSPIVYGGMYQRRMKEKKEETDSFLQHLLDHAADYDDIERMIKMKPNVPVLSPEEHTRRIETKKKEDEEYMKLALISSPRSKELFKRSITDKEKKTKPDNNEDNNNQNQNNKQNNNNQNITIYDNDENKKLDFTSQQVLARHKHQQLLYDQARDFMRAAHERKKVYNSDATKRKRQLDLSIWLKSRGQHKKEAVDPEVVLRAREMFDMLDEDGSNELEFSELQMALKALGINMSTEKLTRRMKEIDLNGDMCISFSEFVHGYSSMSTWEYLYDNIADELHLIDVKKQEKAQKNKKKKKYFASDRLNKYKNYNGKYIHTVDTLTKQLPTLKPSNFKRKSFKNNNDSESIGPPKTVKKKQQYLGDDDLLRDDIDTYNLSPFSANRRMKQRVMQHVRTHSTIFEVDEEFEMKLNNTSDLPNHEQQEQNNNQNNNNGDDNIRKSITPLPINKTHSPQPPNISNRSSPKQTTNNLNNLAGHNKLHRHKSIESIRKANSYSKEMHIILTQEGETNEQQQRTNNTSTNNLSRNMNRTSPNIRTIKRVTPSRTPRKRLPRSDSDSDSDDNNIRRRRRNNRFTECTEVNLSEELPFFLWVPAYYRLRLMRDLMDPELIKREISGFKSDSNVSRQLVTNTLSELWHRTRDMISSKKQGSKHEFLLRLLNKYPELGRDLVKSNSLDESGQLVHGVQNNTNNNNMKFQHRDSSWLIQRLGHYGNKQQN